MNLETRDTLILEICDPALVYRLEHSAHTHTPALLLYLFIHSSALARETVGLSLGTN